MSVNLDELNALVAAHPGNYALRWTGITIGGRRSYFLASDDEPVVASFTPLHPDAVHHLVARANAVPALLVELAEARAKHDQLRSVLRDFLTPDGFWIAEGEHLLVEKSRLETILAAWQTDEKQSEGY